MTVTVERTIPSRSELIAACLDRDGAICMFPGCGDPLDFSIKDHPLEVTIDHWMPQHFGKANDWTPEEIWDVSNLKLMHKRCNAKKGDRVPNEDGTLPEKAVRKFRYRRDKRAERPEMCSACDNGHNLNIGEVCASCGADAQRFPREAKVKYPDCDHEFYWCWLCSITPEMRKPARLSAMRHGEAGEPDGLYGE